MSKLTRIADGFRPKSKPVYEAEPVNLPPPGSDPFVRDFTLGSLVPKDVVGEYRKLNARSWAQARKSGRVTHR